MLRIIEPGDALDAIEDELIHTISALQSDPNAVAFVSLTRAWLETLEKVRVGDRRARRKVINAQARAAVANEHLDEACEAFGAALLEAVGGDTDDPRWRRFFNVPVGLFVRQALMRQVEQVGAWLQEDDPVLAEHREALAQWSRAASVALGDTERLAMVRARNTIDRESLAADLNRERQALYEALVAQASAKGLAEGWPKVFFRTM